MAENKNYSGKTVWETDKHVLLEKNSNQGGVYVVIILIVGVFIIFLLLLILLILPILISLIGFFVDVSFRLWIGICSILAYIYLWFDTQKEWIAYICVYGNKQLDSMFENGLLSGDIQKYTDYIYYANIVGVIIAVYFIFQFFRYIKLEKAMNE